MVNQVGGGEAPDVRLRDGGELLSDLAHVREVEDGRVEVRELLREGHREATRATSQVEQFVSRLQRLRNRARERAGRSNGATVLALGVEARLLLVREPLTE